MSGSNYHIEDAREAHRVKLPPMYTLLRVRRPGERRYEWTGHIYDISTSGMRFELDQGFAEGTEMEIRAMLPGKEHIQIRAKGRVVRIHDAEAGPVRMGMAFDAFHRRTDRDRLEAYIAVQRGERKAEMVRPTRRRAA